jgi:hypothetical protein
MIRHRPGFMIAMGAVCLAGLACSLSLPDIQLGPSLTVEKLQIGEMQTTPIDVPARSGITDLTLEFGAGDLTLQPGGEGLLSGSARFNVSDFEPIVDDRESQVTLRSGNLRGDQIPAGWSSEVVNEWDLHLGRQRPMNLAVNIGAAQATIDLGGLDLRNLDINSGAAQLSLDFSEPMAGEMGHFILNAGAAKLQLADLANAHAGTIYIKAAGATLELGFAGELEQPMSVTIEGAAGDFTFAVPQDTAARMTTSGALLSIEPQGQWSRQGSDYLHPGSGPEITISVTAAAGNITLKTR